MIDVADLDIAALKKLVLFGLNSAMLAGSLLMKLPQILNILKAQSVIGLSEAWVINECIAGLCWVYYNYLTGHPFMAWGEAFIVGIQNVIIVLMYWFYSPELPKLPRSLGALLFVAGSAAVLLTGLPSGSCLLAALGIAPMILGNGAKIPQIILNFRQQHTGTMAFVPALLGFGGNAVRVLTSVMQTPDDPVAILNPLAASVLWCVMFAQFFLYREGTQRLHEEAKAKRDGAKKQKHEAQISKRPTGKLS
ncbi:unnamed protein product [Polarella glacialis]|uniref:Mannose-P-dolichol utilization defect 1 protein homolog n=2 Tax=Polarella glacialis TaxID=89957 RepID=A0A813FGM3_POLGL|nr:unnamed protein product [Polarella glacialis]